jgi:multimeric flavodoxin WrbA
MKVVGIAGSPRAKSNTLHYVETALNVFDSKGCETELILLFV